MANQINTQQDIKIIKIKTDVDWIKKEIEEITAAIDVIQKNCLPTINSQLAKIEANQVMLMWFMMAAIGALIGLFFYK